MEGCSCDGKKSVNWHHYKGVPVCQDSRDRRNAREKAKRASERKPKVVVEEPPCVCEGKRNASWHRYHKLRVCNAAREARNAQERASETKHRVNGKRITWVPGTPIRIPEFDPL